jgi:valacyclovir hydrolase
LRFSSVAKMSSAAAGYTSQKLVLPSSQQPINYVKVGDGDRPTMLLPGALGTAQSDLTTLLDGLNSRGKLTLIAWDPPGYGDSRPPARTWPLNYFERDAEFAVEFMKELGYDKFNVVGWSDGGEMDGTSYILQPWLQEQ